MTLLRGALLLLWAAAAAAGAGCAWGPGGPFGELSTQLDAGWRVAPGRDAGDGWQRLASDYQVRIDVASWTTSKLVLFASAEAALGFDPAAPPPGYSLCHGGHCHAEDGRLVSYEDIAAELAGGEPPPPVLELPTGALDLLAGARLSLGCGDGDGDGGAPCQLGRAEIGRVELAVTALSLAGAVRDGRVPPRRTEAAFTLAATLAQPALPTGRLELPVDRAHAPEIRLVVGAHPGAELLDALDWAALGGGGSGGAGAIDLAASPEAMAAITTAVGEVELELTVERGD